MVIVTTAPVAPVLMATVMQALKMGLADHIPRDRVKARATTQDQDADLRTAGMPLIAPAVVTPSDPVLSRLFPIPHSTIMKTPCLKLVLAACGLALVEGRSMAQERPTQPPPNPPAPADERREGDNDKPRPPRSDNDADRPRAGGDDNRGYREPERSRGPMDRRAAQPEMKPTAYIGVFTRPLSDEVRAQTGLPQGFGLIVEEVMPDSPAQTAGLKQHDILVLLGDQRLVNQDQLAVLVRAEKKDAELVFTVRRLGAEQKITVKVGEKMMPVVFDRDGSRPGVFEPFRGMFDGRDVERFGQHMREQAERFNQGIREFGDRVQDWSRKQGERPGGQQPQRREGDRGANPEGPGRRPQGRPPGEEEPRRDMKSSSSRSSSFQRNVVRRDESGEYSLSENNGAKIFTVKPTTGEEQTFIVNTEEQRKAVPEGFKAKLKELESVDGRVKDSSPPTPPAAESKPGI